MLFEGVDHAKRMLPACLVAFFFSVVLIACQTGTGNIREIVLSSPGNNVLTINANISCSEPVDVVVKYWREDDASHIFTSTVSTGKKQHVITLTNLRPATAYRYKILTTRGKEHSASNVYGFKTRALPFWLQDVFTVVTPQFENLPSEFRKGYIMLYQREVPGILYFVNYKGEIFWYHRVDNTGFKVAQFTERQSILSILGDGTYETSYGNQILELSLTGDTLLNLIKGTNDFTQTIHHEILLTPENNIVTITVEERVMDLSAVGGNKNDTIKTDGIIVLDRTGEKLWHWTVFDVLNPLKEKNILKEKKDWMHANSLTYTPDGNYLISFYNNGQLWKLNSKTGELIWKFGNGGDFKLNGAFPEQCHAVHYINDSTIMLFDNGTSAKTSQVYKISLDEKNKRGSVVLDLLLPKDVFNERMGSAYMTGESAMLICASKRNTVLLTKPDGTNLWQMHTSGISPYRVEFIQDERMKPYLVNN